ncbi:MAG: hypothetical protein QOD73_2263, partial [Solirubrobacteraceae bacterium]|nr:hypothetical protein [Solirubrobacteraceae bacterium]
MSRTTRLPRGSRPAKRPRLSRPVAISLLSLLLIAAASVVAFGDVITKNPIAAGLV